jgi:protein O-mannosyl-transferase
VLYIPALSNVFTNWDDHGYVLDNPNIALTADNLKAMFTGYWLGNYHPFTMLSLSVDHAFGGTTHAFPYHLTNVLLHVLNTALVYFFSLRISQGRYWVALFSAFFFAVHPMHVESVAWVSARKDVLYTAFFFGSLLAYLRHQEKGGYAYYALSFVLGAL